VTVKPTKCQVSPTSTKNGDSGPVPLLHVPLKKVSRPGIPGKFNLFGAGPAHPAQLPRHSWGPLFSTFRRLQSAGSTAQTFHAFYPETDGLSFATRSSVIFGADLTGKLHQPLFHPSSQAQLAGQTRAKPISIYLSTRPSPRLRATTRPIDICIRPLALAADSTRYPPPPDSSASLHPPFRRVNRQRGPRKRRLDRFSGLDLPSPPPTRQPGDP
jgi:hypothetical protein